MENPIRIGPCLAAQTICTSPRRSPVLRGLESSLISVISVFSVWDRKRAACGVVFMFMRLELMFTVLEHVFTRLELMFTTLEHNFSSCKHTSFTNAPEICSILSICRLWRSSVHSWELLITCVRSNGRRHVISVIWFFLCLNLCVRSLIRTLARFLCACVRV